MIAALTLASCGHSKIREVGSLERAPANASTEEQVAYYVDRLGDKDYYEHYSTHEEIPSEWYVAAEELGKIGLPAIPALIDKLKASTDVFERQQIFYALRLAVQEDNARSVVGPDTPYTLEAFPSPEHHNELTIKWLDWWSVHGADVLNGVAELERSAR